MSYTVRLRGTRHELRVRNALLPRPFYASFPTRAEADSYGSQLDALLDRGIVPAELIERETAAPAADVTVASVVRRYLSEAPGVSDSDGDVLTQVFGELADLRMSGLTYRWAGEYVQRLQAARLAPGTIRKRVGALARAIDWHLASGTVAGGSATPVNPLRLLPRGYSQYAGDDAPRDEHRDRRLLPGEYGVITAAIRGERRPDRQRALDCPPGFEVFFSVIVDTGLRLSEAYRLRVDQVDLVRGVLRLQGSKARRGQEKPRVVPLRPHLRAALGDWIAGRPPDGLVWPYWRGDADDLKPCTRRLSARFRVLFEYAGCDGLTEHDLRHEAACRWFELRDKAGHWVFSDVEVCRIMGWASLTMALRYASLRGEDLADRLM